MTALPADSLSDRGHALLRTAQAFFLALEEHKKTHPAEHAEISAACAAHVRSAAPMALLGLPPDAAPVDPVSSVSRELCDGANYEIARKDDTVVISLRDQLDGHAVVALAPIEVVRLRHDLASVAGGNK